MNFNFLPYYADPRLNIFPHTVQFYTFDDPAWTYGNDNFSYMFDFIFENVGKRNVRMVLSVAFLLSLSKLVTTLQVVYHGESAYWCNYDVVLTHSITVTTA